MTFIQFRSTIEYIVNGIVMEIQATDLSARLLATENLTVVRSAVPTASFDIQSRVLTLPIWKDMTPEIEDMLVGHEVAHALYTGEDYVKPIEANPKIMSYLNVIEDVRIEKLIKRKYPGLRKRMNEGYKQLNDRDFFGVKQLPLETLNLIDKMNLYFKAGYQCGVKFDSDEKHFVTRAERTETIEEVIELAQEIYDWSKEQAEKKKKQKQQEQANKPKGDSSDEDEGDPTSADPNTPQSDDDWDGDQEEGKKPASGDAGGKEQDIDEQLESKTERNFNNKLETLADQSTQYIYHKMPNCIPYDPVVPFQRILKESSKLEEMQLAEYYMRRIYGGTMPSDKQAYQKRLIEEVNKFKTDSTSAVNYLVKEFEMKKSATQLKRAHQAKLGSLDMKKVWGYKLKDDLFKRVTVLPDGKNHGMLFLLDWSGSMDTVIEDTLKQVINLAMFCNKVQIPYRVLAFTSQYPLDTAERSMVSDTDYRMRSMTEGQMVTWRGFHLLELFSNRMSMSEFNTMIKRVMDKRFFWNKGYDLGGTPLNEALVWVYHNLGYYMRENRIEKMNFITLSDGAGAHLNSTMSLPKRNYVNGKMVNMRHLVRDDVTKKSYPIDIEQQTESILKMIKDRHGCKVVGFYICPNRKYALGSALKDNLSAFRGDVADMIDIMRKAFKEQGFYSLHGSGRDDLFIVPAEATQIDEGTLEVTADMNSRALSRNLGKYLNTKKTSRILLSKFIDYVA